MNNVFIGAAKATKDKNNLELVNRIKQLLKNYKVNFIDSRNETSWNSQATSLINQASLNSTSNKKDANYIRKVKYDNFEILKYYLKKLEK
jgi:uncharacterized protein (DUF2252 family)